MFEVIFYKKEKPSEVKQKRLIIDAGAVQFRNAFPLKTYKRILLSDPLVNLLFLLFHFSKLDKTPLRWVQLFLKPLFFLHPL